jgi:translation initiation factor 2B subunit (eIF-2B alpha/beta/delta family)
LDRSVSVPAPTVPAMENSTAAQWAVAAADEFRQVARTTENPATRELAKGLTHLAEAIRELAD